MEQIHIIIVEDNELFRQALASVIETSGNDVFCLAGQTGTADEARQLVIDQVPDVALVDLKLDGTFDVGMHLIHDIRAISPTTKVVVVSNHPDDALIFKAFKAGAIGYLLKDNLSRPDVLAYIERAYRGDPALDPSIARRILSHFQQSERASPGQPPVEELTPREKEILSLVGEGLSNKEIAQKLIISAKTVKTHVSNILQKLQLSSRIELQLLVRAKSFS